MHDPVGADSRRQRSRDHGSGPFLRSGGSGYDLDVVFALLSDRRRRIALNYLRTADAEWIPVGDLAERIAAWETELGDPAVVSETSIEIDLVHGHLPKLDRAGVVEFDADRGRVRYRGADRVERFLDVAEREGPIP